LNFITKVRKEMEMNKIYGPFSFGEKYGPLLMEQN
jgi:hypothetical protein